jgi:mannose-6-phosphate isomerase-like protein (cupin superfamily)
MKVIDWKDIQQPLITPAGEIIFELIGAAVEDGVHPDHSLARIVIPPGKSSSAHYHKLSEETYYILKGEGAMRVNGEQFTLYPGQACYLEPGDVHRIENQGKEDLEFLAACTPAWVPEDSFEV